MKVFLLALMGVLSLVYAAEQKDFYGVWFHNDNVFYEINQDAITVFVINYHYSTALKYKYRIVKWKKNDANEYVLYTLSENNSETFFRIYIENSEYDLYIDSGYTKENGTKKSSVEELNKAIKNVKAGIKDAPKKIAEAETKIVVPIAKTPIAKAKVKDSAAVNSRLANAYKTISKVEARRPAAEIKVNYYAFDFRDGKTYKIVTIGKQTWMAENLNYDAKDSEYYENGRLYNWATAKTACPSGWHLPTETEWARLTNSAGGEKTAGNVLKSKDGFYALPDGLGILARGHLNFRATGYRSNWWSATESAKGAYSWNINLNDAGAYKVSSDKIHLFSVRCLRD